MHAYLIISDAARKLVINERKSINALTYMIIVIMAYYGPNAELLGNIKLTIWQFQKPISDIQDYLFNISLLLIVDIFSFVFNGFLLWQFCQINVVKMLKKIQHELWIVFAIAEGFLLMEVHCCNPKQCLVNTLFKSLIYFLIAGLCHCVYWRRLRFNPSL